MGRGLRSDEGVLTPQEEQSQFKQAPVQEQVPQVQGVMVAVMERVLSWERCRIVRALALSEFGIVS